MIRANVYVPLRCILMNNKTAKVAIFLKYIKVATIHVKNASVEVKIIAINVR
jgi:hypothetical protein